MIEATLWGLIGASSLLVGAVISLVSPVHRWLVARHEWRLGLLMAFGSGVLVSAVAYDLFEEAAAQSVAGADVAIGFAIGALVFFVGDELIDRMGAATASPDSSGGSSEDDGTGPLAILLGSILDGVPESIVIGISLLAGTRVDVAVLAAVFLSNIPEAISATGGLAKRFGALRTLGIWSAVVVVSGLAAGLGYAILGGASPVLVTGMQAFAAGAILVMLADEMIPGAYAKGHTAAGLATAFGFAVAAALSFNT